MLESDSIEKFLVKNKNIQTKFINFLDNEENSEENFKNLIKIIDETKIRELQDDFRLFLHMLVKFSNHHHRGQDFYNKILRILVFFTNDIKKYQNSRIFNIFKSNKRILLFLIEEQILTVDEYFVKQIIKEKYLKKKYPQYFSPEIRSFINEKWFPKYNPNSTENKNEWIEEIKNEIPENFIEMRRIGENDSYISKLIREDLVENFIIYVNENNISCNAMMNESIYETNSFLIKNTIKLIDYAAFYGSIQIFTFLKNENVELKSSLFRIAIHSKNAELIQILEENHVKSPTTDEQLYKECFIESIKCNHNEFAYYFLNNFLQNEDEHSSDTIIQSLKYYNFSFLPNENINEMSFCHLCHFDYFSLVCNLLVSRNIDMNINVINNYIFQLYSISYFSMKFKIKHFNKILNYIFYEILN